ncbi:MAG: glycine zipper 2TM domain-containing protein [Rhodoferax sp.]|nr:glycine zipper 2TM domain-containing protein [Rhodoferax sp.]
MKTNLTAVAIVVTATAFLAGCGSAPEQRVSVPTYPATSPANTSYYGVVESIQLVAAERASGGPGVGAIVGGVVGGILGNQVGGGTGKGVATVAGVVGGAVVGNQIDQRNRVPSADSYQVSVRLSNGNYQTFQRDNIADLRPGSRVRIDNGLLYSY